MHNFSKETTKVTKEWLEQRQSVWEETESLIKNMGGAKDNNMEQLNAFMDNYNDLSRDLSMARRYLPNSPIRRYLENLYIRAVHTLYVQPGHRFKRLAEIYAYHVPKQILALRKALLGSVSIFLLTGLFGYFMVWQYPELIGLFASEEMINKVQQGGLWTDNLINVMPSSILSLSIMSNNISVSLFAYGLGAFYGIGTLYILSINGLMLGAIFAFTAHYGLDDALFRFVVAHGIVELSIICIAAAAGLQLGEALVRPGHRSRLQAFHATVKGTTLLLFVIVPFLVLAGMIEGYISPDPAFSLAQRVAVGVFGGVLLFAVLFGRILFARK